MKFLRMWGESGQRIGHSEQFDARIIRIATKRYCDEDTIEAWHAGKENAACTAKLATKICCLPPTEKMKKARRFHHKTPNLTEAYQFFFGEAFDDAHSAMADVQACMAVYFAIQDFNKEATNG